MTTNVLVPELGESIVEATVHEWLKKVGDYVNVGEALVTLETDKVDVEVGAEKNGVLKEIKVEAGTDVAVGDTLAVIDEDAQAEASKNGTGSETAEAKSEEEPKAEADTKKEPEKTKAKQPDKEEAGASPDGKDRVTPRAPGPRCRRW
jgi:2-oxoglutarate dehydrogenase E2 component (dihydrolipoamide succinyltransferase)